MTRFPAADARGGTRRTRWCRLDSPGMARLSSSLSHFLSLWLSLTPPPPSLSLSHQAAPWPGCGRLARPRRSTSFARREGWCRKDQRLSQQGPGFSLPLPSPTLPHPLALAALPAVKGNKRGGGGGDPQGGLEALGDGVLVAAFHPDFQFGGPPRRRAAGPAPALVCWTAARGRLQRANGVMGAGAGLGPGEEVLNYEKRAPVPVRCVPAGGGDAIGATTLRASRLCSSAV